MTNEAKLSDAPAFDATEETWFSEPRTTKRPSQRPTAPPPSATYIDDAIADGWFFDV